MGSGPRQLTDRFRRGSGNVPVPRLTEPPSERSSGRRSSRSSPRRRRGHTRPGTVLSFPDAPAREGPQGCLFDHAHRGCYSIRRRQVWSRYFIICKSFQGVAPLASMPQVRERTKDAKSPGFKTSQRPGQAETDVAAADTGAVPATGDRADDPRIETPGAAAQDAQTAGTA